MDENERKQDAEALDQRFQNSTKKEIFTTIYREKMWGVPKNSGNDHLNFFSGRGSHNPTIVDPYIKAVREFLQTQTKPVTLVDMGCGDFNVGSNFVDLVDKYVAYDLVEEVIEENKKRYPDLPVDFQAADLTVDIPQKGGIAVLRQVLQHLSNADIFKVLDNLNHFRALIFSDILPIGDFEPNLDCPTGRYSRSGRGIPSGVVLDKPPFNMFFKERYELCRVTSNSGVTRTLVFTFK